MSTPLGMIVLKLNLTTTATKLDFRKGYTYKGNPVVGSFDKVIIANMTIGVDMGVTFDYDSDADLAATEGTITLPGNAVFNENVESVNYLSLVSATANTVQVILYKSGKGTN